MTKIDDESREPEIRRCRWCRSALAVRTGRGRPRDFCSQRCRQWDWVARQRARELALSDGELVVARGELDALHDDLFVLACAVADTTKDLADGLQPPEALAALRWLLEAAEPSLLAGFLRRNAHNLRYVNLPRQPNDSISSGRLRER